MKLQHLAAGQVRVHAATSEELATGIATLTAAGYVVRDVEDDPSKPWHVATIHCTGPLTFRTLLEVLGHEAPSTAPGGHAPGRGPTGPHTRGCC
jgi:hypothetical protein